MRRRTLFLGMGASTATILGGCLRAIDETEEDGNNETGTTSSPVSTGPQPTPRETPDPPEVNFRDDWKDATHERDPAWSTNLSGDESDTGVTIVFDRRALELFARNGGTTRVLTEDTFRWDTTWELQGSLKLLDTHNSLANFKIGIATTSENDANWERYFRWKIDADGQDKASLEGLNGPGITQICEKGVWYRYNITHDGDNEYYLAIWEDGTSGPYWNSKATGSTPDTSEENKAGIGLSVQGATVRHAYIHYQTTN